MARLAWFTPLPPVRSGIATYNAELLPFLAETHKIDVFVDLNQDQLEESLSAPGARPEAGGTTSPSADRGAPGPQARRTNLPSPQFPVPSPRVCDAHDFVWKQAKHSYDLVVYQLGNATCHDYMRPYLVRYPGLVVLHDGQLHHARGRLLLQQKREGDYRTEFAYSHPDAPRDVAELGLAGLLGSLNYFWPMLRTAVRSAKLVAVHNARLATELRDQFTDGRIEAINMGVLDQFGGKKPGARGLEKQAGLRSRYGIAADAVVFAAFGRVTPEKRISQALGALASVARTIPGIHLLLVGPTADYYDAWAEAKALGVSDHVTLMGYVEDTALPDYVAAADVCLCLRWPSSGETSGSWLRCLAAAKPTIITDLVHTVDVPALDPRSWTVNYATQEPGPRNEASSPKSLAPSPQPPAPICISLDILDEDHSLKLAMQRLAVDGKLREQLGNRARRFWEDNHTMERMVADYRRVIGIGLTYADPGKGRSAAHELPPHLQPDGAEHARRLLREMGVPADFPDEHWMNG